MIPLRIGVDLDNTIVCYDDVFSNAALSLDLIPPSVPGNKTSIRDYLRQQGREQDWIHLQGHIYGPGMVDAKPFNGVLDFFDTMSPPAKLFIISHRTRHPYKGPRHDLHAAAADWLDANAITGTTPGKIGADCIFFEPTLDAKIERIKTCNCTHFIDDLPNILLHPEFPPTISPILFDSACLDATSSPAYTRHRSWADIQTHFDKFRAAPT